MLQPNDLAETASSDVITPARIIFALVSAIVGMAVAWVKRESIFHKRIQELYEDRIEDLKQAHSLVDTLLEVVEKEQKKKGG